MPFEKDPNDIGALWIKTGRKGEYMTGTITINGEVIKIVAFPNTRKANEKHPDWRLLKSVPKEDVQPVPTRTPHDAKAPQLTDDDIPF